MILLTLNRAPKLSNVPGLLIGMYAVSQALVNQIPSTLGYSASSEGTDLHECSDECRHRNVDNGKSRDGQRNIRAGIGDIPVKRRPGVESHTAIHTANGVEFDVVRCNPGNPAEDRESLEDETGEKEIDHHGTEGDDKEPFTGQGIDTSKGSPDWLVGAGVESLDQS
jgi:hypothetical protein